MSLTSSNTDRFLGAFNELEDLLHDRFPRTDKRFAALVDAASRAGGPMRHYRDDLLAFRELRNVLTHKRTASRPLAEVHPETVARIERIAELVKSPPKVHDYATRKPTTCAAGDKLASVVRVMSEHYLSQVPVEVDGRCSGLLTANTVMRWMGAHADDHGDLLAESVSVEDVLKYREPEEGWRAVRPDTPVTKVLNVFGSAMEQGNPLAAVIVTENGDPAGALRGILTAADLPRLHEALRP